MIKGGILITLSIFVSNSLANNKAFSFADVASDHAMAQQQDGMRGQTVRIRIDDKLVDLYDESHALVIGVSDYTNGWNKLQGVRTDVQQVRGVLEKQGFKVEVMMDPTYETLEQ